MLHKYNKVFYDSLISYKRLLPFVFQAPKLELKHFPDHLKYIFKVTVVRVRRRSEKIHSQILGVGIMRKIRKNGETRNSCLLSVEK
jgi:hypothetical protein